jgi:hypothetical protein
MRISTVAALVFGFVVTVFAFLARAEVFSNPTAGLQMDKPDDWHYVTAAQNLENIKALKLSDEEFHAAIQQYATAPLVAITKYKEPFDDVNPSFKINIKPYGQLKGRRPGDLITMLFPQFERAFKSFQLVQAPTNVVVSGIPSAYARMNYVMETPDGGSFPITSELWIVPRGDYFLMLGAGTRQDEKTGTRKEIEAILSSVKIEQ